jgi:crotonobetainyl-CoA:carnitine CoA-transferase CaiB-like acyl-CoA transferase
MSISDDGSVKQRQPGPLAGLHVVEITHVLAGSYAGLVLADLGADVVKIEPPAGDSARKVFDRTSSIAAFDVLNRGKRGLALDLREPAAIEVVKRLVAQADVFIENYRPGALERLGLGYEQLASVNNRLVHCSISGFGSTGPYRTRGGFDLVAQAMSGLMSLTGTAGMPPVKVGVPVADIGAGVFAALGILAALAHRTATGEGQHVDTSLLEAALSYTIWESSLYLETGEVSTPEGSAHRLSAPYELVRVADGFVVIAAANQETWLRLTRALGDPESLREASYESNRDRVANRASLIKAIEELLATFTVTETLSLLEQHGVPSGPLNDIAQALEDPQVLAREMVSVGEGGRGLGFPVRFSATPARPGRPSPGLGEHNAEVMSNLGFTAAEIDRLAGIADR